MIYTDSWGNVFVSGVLVMPLAFPQFPNCDWQPVKQPLLSGAVNPVASVPSWGSPPVPPPTLSGAAPLPPITLHSGVVCNIQGANASAPSVPPGLLDPADPPKSTLVKNPFYRNGVVWNDAE